MIEIIIALIAATVCSTLLSYRSGWGSWGNYVFPLIACVGLIGLFLYSIMGYSYFAAEYKKEILNREYGTNYTQLEVFYASDVIDTVRELDRKRIELNGDLITGK